MKTYIKHEDPAHGWLEVTLTDLIKAGAHLEISSYSYIQLTGPTSATVYLEEDNDAWKFLSKLPKNSFKIEYKRTNEESFIRDLPSYPQ